MAVSNETFDELSEKEVAVLQLLADGQTIEEAAHTMGLAYVTVRNYIYVAREKLDTPTTFNLVATAVRRGLID